MSLRSKVGKAEEVSNITRQLRSCSALLCVLVLSAVLAQGCSSSGTASPATATGSVHCSSVSGSIANSPPLTTSGSAAETGTVTVKFSHCSTSGSNVSVVSSGVGTSTLTGTSSCSALVKSVAISIDTTWTPKSIKPSIISFSGLSVTKDTAGDAGYALPGTGGRAKVIGSFAGNDKGAGSTVSVYTNETATQLVSACSEPSGLASVTFASGEATFG